MPDHDIADRLFHHLRYRELREQIDAWGERLQAKMDHLIKQQGEIMSAQNQSGEALQAAESRMEQAVADFGTKLLQMIKDFQDKVTAELQAAGVPTAVVDAVTARTNTLADTVVAMAGTVTAADPGPQATPPPQA